MEQTTLFHIHSDETRLRHAGVPQTQIDEVIEIARHIRDEADEKLNFAFDAATSGAAPAPAEGEACCTPTKGGQSYC